MMPQLKIRSVLACVTLLFFIGVGLPAPLKGEIVLGMTASFENPTDRLGVDLQQGVLAALGRANRQGGIRGRMLKLVVMDDGYDPVRSASNIRSMLFSPPVLVFIGCGGTAPAITALPIIRETGTLFFAPYSGAGFLRREPPERYVINFRVSYAEEASAMIHGLVINAGIPPDEIAFFTQRDGFGDAGYEGGIAALKRYGLMDDRKIIHSRYERNTLLVENGLAEILRARKTPRAIVIFGTYRPVAKFVQLSRRYGYHPLFIASSVVGDRLFAKEVGAEGEGVIITGAVPHTEASLPLVSEYREDIGLLNSPGIEPSFISLESYVATRILLRALETISGTITRKNVIDALENLGTFDIGLGKELTISSSEHQASHHIWPMILRAGRFEPFAWTSLGREKGGKRK